MSKTINVIGVVDAVMTPNDSLPSDPLVWLTLAEFGTERQTGAPLLSGSLASDAEIDEQVRLLKEDLDRAAKLAKAKLKAGRETTTKILAAR